MLSLQVDFFWEHALEALCQSMIHQMQANQYCNPPPKKKHTQKLADLCLETWQNPTHVYRGLLEYLLMISHPSPGRGQGHVVSLWISRREQ